MSKPKLCLNMIVKNEAHVITETLECVSKYIDYYVVVDTGSTDKTISTIKDFFESKNIPGKIYEHDFRTCKCHSGIYKKYSFFHFGWNRTYALQMCKGLSEYIWVMDADDIIVGDMDFSNLTHDAYTLKIGTGFTYERVQIFKNELNFFYKEPLHEYPTCSKKNYIKSLLPGKYYMDSRRLGDRSKASDKYVRDAQVFEEILLEEPDNERSMFYCAQSYYDCQDYANSLKWYKKRVEKGGWYEETYFAYYKIGECMEQMMKINATYTWLEVEKAYIEAYNYCKLRSEPFYHIAKHYREYNDFKNGYMYAKKAAIIPFPKHDVLFIFKNVYDYKAKDEMARCAFALGKFHESYNISKNMLNSGTVETYDIDRIKTMMTISEKKVGDLHKQTCCMYFGNDHITSENSIRYSKMVDDISRYYNLTIIGNNINNSDMCKDSDVLIFSNSTTNMDFLGKFKFNYLILCDSINYFHDNINIYAEQVILYQNDNLVKLRLDSNIYASIHNSTYLNNYFQKITKIMCIDNKNKNEFISIYNLNTDSVDALEEEYHKLFDNIKRKYTFNLEINNETNGLVYYEPKYMVNIDKKYVYGKEIILNVYENIIKKFPTMIEHYVKLFNVLYALGEYNSAQWKLDKALSLLKNNNKLYEPIILIHKAKILAKTEKYEESYELANNILQKRVLPDVVRETFEDLRDDNIMHFKDKYLAYPLRKIKSMKNETNDAIAFTITTCKRFDLFEKTMNSFLNCCMDSNLIGHWLCVDDNSSKEDRDKMKKAYPFFKFIWKNETQKGHYISMNIIRDYVIEIGATHVLHCEDDFHYFQKKNYITDSLKIFGDDDKIGQVLFNRNYAEADFSQRKIKGGINKSLQDGTRYVIHEHYESGTKDYDDFLRRHSGYGTCGYWEGFSFRPSVVKVNVLKDVGPYYNTDHFERAYAVEYKLRGYKSAFFDTHCCLHTGKKTWEKAPNSYTLNNTGQFNLDKSNLSVNVLKSNIDTFRDFKECNMNKLPHFVMCDVKQIGGLDDFEKNVLLGNEFSYLRPIASKLLYHINMFRHCKSKNMLFLRDTVRLDDTFNSKLEKLMKSNFDLILLDNENGDNEEVVNINEKINFDMYYGYLISNKGMGKIIEFVSENKIKNENYLDGIQNLNMFRCHKLYDVDVDISVTVPINENTLYKHYDGYKFYCLMDSFGHDLNYIEKKPIDEIKNETEKLGGKAFNTLGWIKHSITPEDQFINLPNSNQTCDGLYVKI